MANRTPDVRPHRRDDRPARARLGRRPHRPAPVRRRVAVGRSSLAVDRRPPSFRPPAARRPERVPRRDRVVISFAIVAAGAGYWQVSRLGPLERARQPGRHRGRAPDRARRDLRPDRHAPRDLEEGQERRAVPRLPGPSMSVDHRLRLAAVRDGRPGARLRRAADRARPTPIRLQRAAQQVRCQSVRPAGSAAEHLADAPAGCHQWASAATWARS